MSSITIEKEKKYYYIHGNYDIRIRYKIEVCLFKLLIGIHLIKDDILDLYNNDYGIIMNLNINPMEITCYDNFYIDEKVMKFPIKEKFEYIMVVVQFAGDYKTVIMLKPEVLEKEFIENLRLSKNKICGNNFCSSRENEERKFNFCGRCGSVKYCSKRCQIDDWKNHKLYCEPRKKND